MHSRMNIGFVGLGKLGLPVAEEMSKSHNVTGFDINRNVGTDNENLSISNSLIKAVLKKDFVFIAVPTPHHYEYGGHEPSSHLESRDFDYSILKNAVKDIMALSTDGQKIVIISTCLPGTTERELANFVPSGVHLFYNPYFIAMGSVVEDFLNPEFVLIGTKEGTEEAARPLIDFYKTIIPDATYRPMTWNEAECTKVFYNTWISWKIGFANMIQDVSMKIGNMNSNKITDALSDATKRIVSPMYLNSGMGDGGACHPRDNIALRSLSERLDLGYDLFGTLMQSREQQAKNMAKYVVDIKNTVKPADCVVICGRSYKPGVSHIDGSASALVQYYIQDVFGTNVIFSDPLTGDEETPCDWPRVYLLAHDDDSWHDYVKNVADYSVIVDPWQKCPDIPNKYVIHYGDTTREIPWKKITAVVDNPYFDIPPNPTTGQALISNGRRGCPVTFSLERNNWIDIDYVTLSEANVFNKKSTGEREPWIYPLGVWGVGPRWETGRDGDDTFLQGIPSAVLEAIRLTNGYLLLSCQYEGTSSDKLTFDILHNKIKEHLDIPFSKFIFVTANMIFAEQYHSYCDEYGIDDRMNIMTVEHFEAFVGHEIKNDKLFLTRDSLEKGRSVIRDKNFLCLNRVLRWHRIALVMKLVETGLIDKGFVSFASRDSFDDKTWEHALPKLPVRNALRLAINNEEFFNHLPMILDVDNFETNHAVTHESIRDYYLKTYFSMVTETKMEKNTLFTSEKIFKPIANFQPFVLMGSCGTLKHLRELGYRTFDGFIDESYDEIEDPLLRLEACYNELSRLCSMSIEETHEWYWSMEDILLHNRETLESRMTIADNMFKNQLYDILY